MNRYASIVLFAAVAATATAGAVAVAAPSGDSTTGDPPVAIHGSVMLDLAEDWGTAGACVELGDVTECFDTEADLLAAHPEVLGATRSAGRATTALAAAGVGCSSSLRLYDGNWYTGGVLYLTTRGVAHNLSNFGFDNVTSSYRVGACSASFFALANLGGAVYPGYTGAWAQATAMLPGWSNVVSSVYIY